MTITSKPATTPTIALSTQAGTPLLDSDATDVVLAGNDWRIGWAGGIVGAGGGETDDRGGADDVRSSGPE